MMNSIINSPDAIVAEALAGLAAADRTLKVHSNPVFVARADAPIPGKVAVISGGGSGHEPLHTGYVGAGMLDAACPGHVFTSPTPDQIHAAALAVNGGAGVLYIVKNYTGDVLNFEIATELAAAEGIQVDTVIVDDDVAVRDSTWTAGRRGVAGCVLVEKIAGAAAARGHDLATVKQLAHKTNARTRSMGIALSACVVPHSREPSFDLAEGEMEVGIGIHGEPGRYRRQICTANDMVAILAEPILEDLPWSAGDQMLLMVNGMGGTPLAELYVAFNAAMQLLTDRRITVAASLVGNYVTSLDMRGMSLTLLALDEELTSLWEAPVNTSALRWGGNI